MHNILIQLEFRVEYFMIFCRYIIFIFDIVDSQFTCSMLKKGGSERVQQRRVSIVSDRAWQLLKTCQTLWIPPRDGEGITKKAKRNFTRRGDRTHDHTIKSRARRRN